MHNPVPGVSEEFSGMQSQTPPSKCKTFVFVIAIIVTIGSLVTVGGVGLGGYLQAGSLSQLGQVNAIIMMATSGGAGIIFLIAGIVVFIKNRLESTAATRDGTHAIPSQFEWNHLDQHAKVDLVNTILANPREGTKQIRIADDKIINLHYQFKDSGTSANVYIVNVGETRFALKILHSNKLGDSAKGLQGHSITGIVPLQAAEILNINGEERAIIVMGDLEAKWSDWFEKPGNPKSSDLAFGLSCIREIIESLIQLEKQGFVHGNIGAPNIMFDKQDRIYIVDMAVLKNS